MGKYGEPRRWTALALLFLIAHIGVRATDNSQGAGGISLSPSNEGVVLSVPGMGAFTVSYPIIEGKKIVARQSDKTRATVTYEGGIKLDVTMDGRDAVHYRYDNLPAGIKKVEMDLPLPESLAQGGSFRVNDGAPILFPAILPLDPDLFADHQVHRVGIHDGMFHSFVMHPPDHSFLEVVDGRDISPGFFLLRVTSPLTADMSLSFGDRPAETAPAHHGQITIPRTTKPLLIDGRTDAWAGVPSQEIPSSRLVDGTYLFVDRGESAAPDLVSATFQLCWDENYLYLLAKVNDPTPMHNNNPRNDKLWTGDGVELYIGGEGVDVGGDYLSRDRQFTFGVDEIAGAVVQMNGLIGKPPVRAVVVPSQGGYTLEAAVPFTLLGFQPAEGHPLRLDVGINDSADGRERRCQLMWNGTNQNSVVRTDWGNAVLGK